MQDLLRRVKEEPIIGSWICELRFVEVAKFSHRGAGWLNEAVQILPSHLLQLRLVEFSGWRSGISLQQSIGSNGSFFERLSGFTLVETLRVSNMSAAPWFICALVTAFPELKHVSLCKAFDLSLPASDLRRHSTLYLRQPKLRSLHLETMLDIDRNFLRFICNTFDVGLPTWASLPDSASGIFNPVETTLREMALPSPNFYVKLISLAPILPSLITLRIAVNDCCWGLDLFKQGEQPVFYRIVCHKCSLL